MLNCVVACQKLAQHFKEILLQLKKNLKKKKKIINVKKRERNSSTIIAGDFTPNSHKWTVYSDRNDTSDQMNLT